MNPLATHPLIYDLHSHTTASDGLLTPSELVLRAVNNEVNVLAITDHDTVNGLAEAHQTILAHKLPLHLVNGVEISTNWQSYSNIHIVGLNIDPTNEHLLALLKKQGYYRIERALQISEKLNKVSIPNAYEQAKVFAKGDIVSRSHFARFLVEKGYAKDLKRAFKKYLGKSGYAYVSSKWPPIETAIEAIHQANGIAVLAHPTRYDLTLTKLRSLIEYFKACNGDGIEVSQSRQTLEDLALLTKYAKQYQLLASQGSDFHDFTSYLDLGKTQALSNNLTPVWHNWLL